MTLDVKICRIRLEDVYESREYVSLTGGGRGIDTYREICQDSFLPDWDSIRGLWNTAVANRCIAEWFSSRGTQRGGNNLALTRRSIAVPQILRSAAVIEDSGPAVRRCDQVQAARIVKNMFIIVITPRKKYAWKFEPV
jgi:hypothetical protein